MTREELNDRLNKLEVKVEKINARIEKWQNKKNEAAYIKDKASWWTKDPKSVKTMDDLLNAMFNYWKDRETLDSCKIRLASDYEEWLSNCDREIRYAERDLSDLQITRNKYLNALALIDEKESKPVIQIFKDFFNNWKEEIIKFIEPLVEEYYRLNSESCDLHNNRWMYLKSMSEEEYKEKCKELNDRQKYLKSISWVNVALDKGFRRNRTEFNKFIDKYMEDRYYELVDKVTKFTGNITDVSNLRVGIDGTLNGIVSGEEGKANLETITAGGYNQDIIVNSKHGQCLHYRVLVNRIN